MRVLVAIVVAVILLVVVGVMDCSTAAVHTFPAKVLSAQHVPERDGAGYGFTTGGKFVWTFDHDDERWEVIVDAGDGPLAVVVPRKDWLLYKPGQSCTLQKSVSRLGFIWSKSLTP
jgi:hypothetical protein